MVRSARAHDSAHPPAARDGKRQGLAARANPRLAGAHDRPRRLQARQRDVRPQQRPRDRRARLGDVHHWRSAGRFRLDADLLALPNRPRVGRRDRQHGRRRRMAAAARDDRSIRAPHRARDARFSILSGVRAVQARDHHGGQLRPIRARTGRRSSVRRHEATGPRACRRRVEWLAIPMPDSDLLAELARFIERITAIARTGLAFKPDGFDSERYEELLKEAARMHAVLAGANDEDAEALRRRWREQVIAGYEGYVTAASGCGVIAFNERDEILLIQRPTGKWWYPTGFCDVGVSPAENAAKEAREETGLIVEPERLIAVIDSKKYGSPARHIYSMLFYCRIVGGELKPNPLEAVAAGFVPLDRLPQPLHGIDGKWIALAGELHFG